MTHPNFRQRIVLVLLLGLLLAGFQQDVTAQADPISEMFQLINDFRASLGLPPFQYNAILASAAQGHASWMAANVSYTHTGAGGSTPLSRATAAGYSGYVVENIVGGTNMSPRQGLIWWQNSPVHYNTLVTERYPQAGVGFASNGQQNMFVLVVGRPPGPYEAPPRSSANERTSEPLIITPIQLSEPREDGSIIHTMQPGQALWTVAAYYDVDLDYLYLINNLTEDDVLHPGDDVTVRLAEGQLPPPTPTPPLTHVIREGESAWSIALQNGISTGYLYQLNNIDENSILHPGNELIVRLAEGQPPLPTPTPKTYHMVQSGESLWAIAAQYGLTLEELTGLNELSANSVIRQGDQLLIRALEPTPLPVTAVAAATGVTIAYPPPASSTPTAFYPGLATAVSQLPEIFVSPTPSNNPSEDETENGDQQLSTGLITFIVVGMVLVAVIVVIIIRRLREAAYLP